MIFVCYKIYCLKQRSSIHKYFQRIRYKSKDFHIDRGNLTRHITCVRLDPFLHLSVDGLYALRQAGEGKGAGCPFSNKDIAVL